MIARVTQSVLVVDDDPEFRKLAAGLLAAVGLTVVGEAGSAAEALAAAARFEPSAVLLDSSCQTETESRSRELTALPWHPRVVLTSIDADITSTEEAQLAGARGLVDKADLPNAPLAQLLGGEEPAGSDRAVRLRQCQSRYEW
jgi:CheY-like chemotaxis protein